MDIKIYNRNFDLTQPLRDYLHEKFGALEKYNMNILGFHVEMNRDNHHQKGEVYNIEVHLHLPDKQTITMKEIQDDAYAAIDLLQTKIARAMVKLKAKNTSKFRRAAGKLRALKFWSKSNKEY
ncbi:MAG: ribosomal subunit interface protein [Parcubacteria group bacterium]|nr:MAG: ribosomal subunit interface protein [Parcubacteria group bacterium]